MNKITLRPWMVVVGVLALSCASNLLIPNQRITDRNELVGVYNDPQPSHMRSLVLFADGTCCCEARPSTNEWAVVTGTWKFGNKGYDSVTFHNFPGVDGVVIGGFHGCPVFKRFGSLEMHMGQDIFVEKLDQTWMQKMLWGPVVLVLAILFVRWMIKYLRGKGIVH